MNKDMYTYREFRTRTIMWGQLPIFRNIMSTKTPKYLHHTSMYAFNEQDAKLQARLGNTKYREVTHYSAELVIDTDNLDTAVKLYDSLIEKDITFELWKLNNYKFYLQRDELDLPTSTMCFQDRQFVRELFSDCNVNQGLDLGIYSSPFHLCRAKGAIHEVTGKKSILEYQHIGSNLISTNEIELRVFEKPLENFKFDPNVSDWEQLQLVLNLAQGKCSNKHFCLYALGKEIRNRVSWSTGCELAIIYANSLNYEEDKALRGFEQGWQA